MLVEVIPYDYAQRNMLSWGAETGIEWGSGHLSQMEKIEINVNNISKIEPKELIIEMYSTKTVTKYFWPFKFLKTTSTVNELSHHRATDMHKIIFNDNSYLYTDWDSYQLIKTALNS